MKLYFKDSKGKMRCIAIIDERNNSEQIKMSIDLHINKFCLDRGFKIYYTRVWNEEINGKLMTKFDVGSHTEFFYVDPPCYEIFQNTENY